MKNLNVKRKNRKNEKNHFKIICYTCQKKHYISNCFQFSKNAKMKTNVNVVKMTKKKLFEKKNSQIFKNNKRIKNESNFVYKITIINNDEKDYLIKILLNVVVEINVVK